MKKPFTVFILLISVVMQSQIIKKIEPAFWWADMKYNQVQVMVYGTGISNYTPVVKDKLVRLVSVDKSENKNYLFLNLDFSQSTATNFEIKFKKKLNKKCLFIKITRKN